ncbi:phosphoribosylglycinamide formyltransferase [Sulfurihydrogenibium azorense]|uniref:Phosphoribosylglycinamide formyltransferase n=1 Tax=Sulfurihydrogenibium azorense (strain DSM 15241 / OCM 825 / Az-Fu1) TaxID=204536 RepID=C1DXL7_SULAA|nr:phosphoribosylglycinamide formyltransferase [Sulfurihydrogenibium azorense]ACN98539.1 phosphoribosylglycinamide formyltransferase [Sulfurihydrogenibium azorense Az-Fu1]MDM7272984.1 phosphoribosylglycinamide formyltransferase [Sulfurihydrogenibium azorense]
MKNLVVLISGRGSNLKAIINAIESRKINAKISLVLSNKKEAKGLEIAKNHGIKTKFIDPSFFSSREGYDIYIAELIKKEKPDLIVLAGYMRILSDEFIDAFEGKIVNIHPSLIPAFQGKNAQKQALEFGSLITGCSVHFVTKDLDSGPVIIQAAVPVLPEDTEETLSERILSYEHRIYPQAIKWILEGRVKVEGRKVIVKDAKYGTIPVNPSLEDF